MSQCDQTTGSTLKIIHTSDWHLGHTLHGLSREAEHQAFLDWLAIQLIEEEADALLVAGDIFETANPGIAAVRMLFRFLTTVRERCPKLDIVLIAGNHDSAHRLDLWSELLGPFRVHVVGTLLEPGCREPSAGRLIVPLTDASGAIAARVVAVPFLRPTDLPVDDGTDDWLVEGVCAVYKSLLETARAQMGPDEALLAMGHCFMVGGKLSELSERKVLMGNQHALPADRLFPDDVAYAALGHLHRAQLVDDRDNVRYCGSPIPLSLDEVHYPHQIVVVELDGPELAEAPRHVLVPRSVEVLRVPEDEPKPLAEVLPELEKLPEHCSAVQPPFLEVRVRADEPDPGRLAAIEKALRGKAVRLAKLSVSRSKKEVSLRDSSDARTVAELKPEEVLRKRWASCYDGREPGDEVLGLFHEILDTLDQTVPEHADPAGKV